MCVVRFLRRWRLMYVWSQVEKMREEVVQLKILQSSLMLLQSPAVADSEVCAAVPLTSQACLRQLMGLTSCACRPA